MIRSLKSLLWLFFLVVAGCPTHDHYKYDCRGKLMNADGSPATGVAIHIDTEAPKEQLPSKDIHWWETYRSSSETWKSAGWVWWEGYSFMDRTSQSGEFATNCDLDVDLGVWGRLGDQPPAPELRKVWVWLQSPAGWIAIPVRLAHEFQTHRTAGGREIDLPPLTLPQAATRPASSQATVPKSAER